MELLKDELYKIFSKKLIYVAIIIFIIYNLFAMRENGDLHIVKGAYNKYFEDYEGKIDSEKIERAKKFGKDIENMDFRENREEYFGKCLYHIEVINIENCKENYLNWISNLEENLSKFKPNSYKYKADKLEYEILKKRGYKDSVYYTAGWDEILESNSYIVFLFIGILIILGVSPVFSEEYNSKMDNIILSSRHGKGKLILSKITAVLIYCIFVVLIFSLFELVTYGILYGFKGYNVPLKNLQRLYEYTSFDMPVIKFYFIQRIFILLGSFAFGLFVLIMSSLNKNYLVSAFISGMVFLVPYVSDTFNLPTGKIFAVTYTDLVRLDGFGQHINIINFLGNPMLYHNFLLIFIPLLYAVSISLIYFLSIRHQVS